ncbi:PEP-CTERM sorting domain-containing protein [bacterium]|nr:PEP-CTERM sorting domain-containing protein [bacterium]
MMKHSRIAPLRRMMPIVVALFVVVPVARSMEYFQGFDDLTLLPGEGWSFQNLSDPPGTSWLQGNPLDFPAQAGPTDSFLAASFLSGDGNATISNWAITPTLTYSNGDTFKFYSRTRLNPADAPDRLEVRLSTAGSSADVGASATSVGDFTTLLLTINPALTTTGYPAVWTEYVVTLAGLAGPTEGRMAFRYFVTNGGPLGVNGDYIGIDTLSITSVPEPSTYALGSLGACVLAFAGRRLRTKRT